MRRTLKLLLLLGIGLALMGKKDGPSGTPGEFDKVDIPPKFKGLQGNSTPENQADIDIKLDKGDPRGSESDPSEGDQSDPHGDIEQTGGSTRPKEGDYDGRDQWAEDAYEYFRQSDQDVSAISDNLSEYQNPDGSPEFTEADIEAAKNNLMVDEHMLTDYDTGGYSPGRFDASDNIASAWTRLANGEPHPSDIVLLRHEIAESRYFSDNPGAPYAEAHQYANSVSNWEVLEEAGDIPYDRNDYNIFG